MMACESLLRPKRKNACAIIVREEAGAGAAAYVVVYVHHKGNACGVTLHQVNHQLRLQMYTLEKSRLVSTNDDDGDDDPLTRRR